MNSLSTDICYEIGVRQTYLHRLLQLVYYYSIRLLFTYVLLLLLYGISWDIHRPSLLLLYYNHDSSRAYNPRQILRNASGTTRVAILQIFSKHGRVHLTDEKIDESIWQLWMSMDESISGTEWGGGLWACRCCRSTRPSQTRPGPRLLTPSPGGLWTLVRGQVHERVYPQLILKWVFDKKNISVCSVA